MHRQAIGIDIGGSSIKAAVVDLSRGCLVGERHSVPSPAMSAVSEMLHAMLTMGVLTPQDVLLLGGMPVTDPTGRFTNEARFAPGSDLTPQLLWEHLRWREAEFLEARSKK